MIASGRHFTRFTLISDHVRASRPPDQRSLIRGDCPGRVCAAADPAQRILQRQDVAATRPQPQRAAAGDGLGRIRRQLGRDDAPAAAPSRSGGGTRTRIPCPSRAGGDGDAAHLQGWPAAGSRDMSYQIMLYTIYDTFILYIVFTRAASAASERRPAGSAPPRGGHAVGRRWRLGVVLGTLALCRTA